MKEKTLVSKQANLGGEVAADEIFTVKQAAERLGVKSSVVRFYCNRGLVRSVRRTRRGYRIFTPEQLDWLYTLCRLRQAGFSIEQLKEFAKLHYSDDDTAEAEKALLATQKRQLWQEIAERQQAIDFIERREEVILKEVYESNKA